MFKQTAICRAIGLALAGGALVVALPAAAQETQRVEVTGSAIKRVDAETAVPITVLRTDDLKAQGINTVEQVMSALSAMQIQTSTSQVVGSGSGGASYANMRGIGANKTLVLLNGRRIANNAYDSSAPDLNMIPFAAIDRVEVLRDGASSLYGTDAVGGVINFITKRDFTGGAIELAAFNPQHPGGKGYQANAGFGFGDLTRDRFNIFGFVDYNKTDRITGTQRPFNVQDPGGPGGLSPTPWPANFYQDPNKPTYNQTAPNCVDPTGAVTLVPASDTSCYIATAAFVNYTPKTERVSGMVRGSFAVNDSNTLTFEAFATQNKVESLIAPVPYGTLWMNPRRPDGSANPYFPGNVNGPAMPAGWYNPTYTQKNMSPRPGVTLQPGFITVKWRDLAHGQRQDSSTNDQQRFVLQWEGSGAGWDYQAGLAYNKNKVKQMISGYSDGNRTAVGVANGVINPFGPQDAAGTKLIDETGLAGNLQNARGVVKSADMKASRDLGDWFGSGRSAALALGAEFRNENFWQAANTPFAELVVASTGIDPTSVSQGKRNVSAVFTEFSLPILKSLELSAALRHDRYSDFGSTTNPKFTLRYQPVQSVVLRATYSTGFRAPSLYDINASPYYTNTGTVSDPVNCPGGVPIPGKSKTLNCNVQFQAMYGGNTSLKPEKSKGWTLGAVFEPTPNFNVGIDLWKINLTDAIGSLSSNTVLTDAVTFGKYYHRNPGGDLSIDGFSCPGSDCGYIDLRTQNLGGTKTAGVDLTANYRQRLQDMGILNFGVQGTYVTKYEYQDYANGPWKQNVGVYSGASPVFRWQHTASASWAIGGWTTGLALHYKSGYVDQDPENTVKAYSTADAFVSWAPASVKGLSMTFGIKNLMDVDPPYSNQQEVFQANYDPRYSDPTGRTYYLRVGYRF